MKTLIPFGTIGLAGLVGAGVLSFPATTVVAGGGDEVVTKRDEDSVELVLVDDDDDNDSNHNSRSTGFSRSTGDHTRSNFSRVSRDRDLSRSDNTRDRTRDGRGDRTRDWSQNRTNDRSRNDTR